MKKLKIFLIFASIVSAGTVVSSCAKQATPIETKAFTTAPATTPSTSPIAQSTTSPSELIAET